MQAEAAVIVPQAATAGQIGVDAAATPSIAWPTLWLLHGLSDDHTIWLRRTAIERYAEARGIAVVMPNAHRSFYCDMVAGNAYWTYISDELPRLMRNFFPLSSRREDNAVAGLSMGGYGAAMWLLRKPEAFIAGVSLSGVMDIAARHRRALDTPEEPLRRLTSTLVFGSASPAGTDRDLFHLLDQRAADSAPPPLRQVCGTEDFLLEDNRRFRDHARRLAYPLLHIERPGDHEWGFWDAEIEPSLDWLQQQGFAQASR